MASPSVSSPTPGPPPPQPAAPPSRQEIERKLSVHSISPSDTPRTRMTRKASLPLPVPSSPVPSSHPPSSFFPGTSPPSSSSQAFFSPPGFSASPSSPSQVQRSPSLQYSPKSGPAKLPPSSSVTSPVDPSSPSISSLPPQTNTANFTAQPSTITTSTSQNLAAISETAGLRAFSDSENDLDYEGEDEDEEEDEGEEGEEDGEMRRKVQGERVLKSGYLEKKGEKRKNWKKRWFVLRTEKLSYYKDDREYKLLRLIDLHDIHSVALVQLKKYASAICIVTQTRTYYVKARTTTDAESWVEAIKLARKDLKEADEAKTRSPPQAAAGGAGSGVGGGAPVGSKRVQGSASSNGGGGPFPSTTSAAPSSNRSVSPSHSVSSAGAGVGLFMPGSPFQTASSAASSAPTSPPSPLRISPHQPEWVISPSNEVSSPSSPTRGGMASSSEDEDFDEHPLARKGDAPQVISTDPNKVILSGYLMKMGKRKNWRKRWFVLTSGSLVYCSSHMDTKPHRTIPLSRILDALEYEPAPKESSALSNPLRAMSDSASPDSPSVGNPSKTLSGSSSVAAGLGDKSSASKHVEHSLKIVTAKKAFILCAPSEEEEIKWLSAIQALVARRTGGSPARAASSSLTTIRSPPLPSPSSTIRAPPFAAVTPPSPSSNNTNIPTILEQPPSPPAASASGVPGIGSGFGQQQRTPSPSRQPTQQTHSHHLPSIESQISQAAEKFPRSGSESETGGSSQGGAPAQAERVGMRRERSDTTAGKEAVENVRRRYHPEEPEQ